MLFFNFYKTFLGFRKISTIVDKKQYILQTEMKDEGVYRMRSVVLDEITNELNWRERIIVNVFTKTFIKVYNISRIKIVNKVLI